MAARKKDRSVAEQVRRRVLASRDRLWRIEDLGRFVQLLGRDDVRIDRLVAASRTEPPAVRERLRAVMLEANETAAADRIRRARDLRTRERALRVLPTST